MSEFLKTLQLKTYPTLANPAAELLTSVKSTIKMLIFNLIVFFGISLFITNGAIASSSAAGAIEGVVFDKKTGETLVGAQIILEGTTVGTITDFDGHFRIDNVATGVYNVRISYISYNPVIFEDIKVEASKTVQIKAEMEEVSVAIGDITVVAERRKGSDVSIITAIKSNSVVSSGISNQQIQRSQDRDASEVVKRVPGVTIQGDRFIVVRGLNQRYNNVWLNNSAAPSSEADSRAFSFDVIPSSMIENMIIYKAPAPELPGDFSGGFVKILTKDVPESNNYSLSIGTAYITGTTFGDFKQNEGGKLDFLGYDDGTRKLPSVFPDNLNSVGNLDKVQYSRLMNRNWTTSSKTALPDFRLSYTMSHRFKLNKITLGEVTALTYSNTRSFDDVENNSYGVYRFAEDRPGYDFAFRDSVYSNSAKIGLMHNWSAFLGKGHKIEFRNLYHHIGTTKTSYREGTEYYSTNKIRAYEHGFMSRTTYLGQLSGTHSFNKGISKLDWTAGYSVANRNEPDIKRIKLIQNELQSDANYGKYGVPFTTTPNSSQVGHLFMETNENALSFGANFQHIFDKGHLKPTVKAGVYAEQKNRNFEARRFGYIISNQSQFDRNLAYMPFDQIFTDVNINNENGIRLEEETRLTDHYKADNLQLAGYASVQLPVGEKLNIYAGVRVEKNRQTLESYDRFQQPIEVVNDTLDILPSVNITYNINEKHLLRVAYGKSLNRPEFREIAPFPFYDFEHNAIYSGNPDLKNAKVHNAEIRYEFYPSAGETFSVGAFYKQFYNPIEIKYLQTGSGLEYSYQNADKANNFGLEAEIRKTLASNGWMKYFSVVMNGAWIKSKVEFNNNVTDLERPLSGQSPFIVNAGIFYQDEEKSRLMINLLYNVIGKRINIVGIPQQNKWENIPDIYEMPRHLIDLIVSKKLEKNMELKVGIKDLLNQPVTFRQDVDATVDMSIYNGGATDIQHFNREQVTRKYRPGSSFSVDFAVKF